MNYPLISEYIESIRFAEDNFATLTNLRPVLDDNGNPIMSSGNFAVVFKMQDIETKEFFAIKCFTREQEGREDAYLLISEELAKIKTKVSASNKINYLVDIKYLNNELFVDSNNSTDTEFPILLMVWVEGDTLYKYILDNKYDGYKLACLVYNFYKLSDWLLAQPFAHGDIKPENIIVTNKGNLFLIDYDGMYVPKMFGQEPRESGSPNYRLPFTNNTICSFNNHIDDFAIIHILLSLNVYSLWPNLIRPDKDVSLFSDDEFGNLCNSSSYKELISNKIDKQTSFLIMLLQKVIAFGYLDFQDWQQLFFVEPKQDNYINLEEEMSSLDNIVKAMELAYYSMFYKDPARNEYEISWYKELSSRIIKATEIQGGFRQHSWPYGFDGGIKYSYLKPNGVEEREGVALDFGYNSLRYLWGLIKYKSICKTLSKNVYGGGIDVFTVNYDENKYNTYLEAFIKTQEECAQQYKYLYVFDIKDFFKNVDISKLKEFYFGNEMTNVKGFDDLFNNTFEMESLKGLNPCSEVDSFFANLYLKTLDDSLSKIDGLKYFRYCDDIRIFSNNGSLFDELNNSIASVLSLLSLKLNTEKSKLIDTANEKIELAKACFVWSCQLYCQTDENHVELVDGKKLKEIIQQDLTTVYIFNLLRTINERAISENGSLKLHIDNLFYVLKNVHKNATFYRLVSELVFEIGLHHELDGTLFSYILDEIVKVLRDENIEPFVKYWILRTYFCSDKQYYTKYIEEENTWKDQSWYPNPCYNEQIIKMLDVDFRRVGTYQLISHLADYVISKIKPSMNMNTSNNEDELPF